uniref:Uncharacterized protein n=1 Tax=Tetraselmis sp. GSL018 TaxID=582737 RepID=A0A061SC77_9CHLO
MPQLISAGFDLPLSLLTIALTHPAFSPAICPLSVSFPSPPAHPDHA